MLNETSWNTWPGNQKERKKEGERVEKQKNKVEDS